MKKLFMFILLLRSVTSYGVDTVLHNDTTNALAVSGSTWIHWVQPGASFEYSHVYPGSPLSPEVTFFIPGSSDIGHQALDEAVAAYGDDSGGKADIYIVQDASNTEFPWQPSNPDYPFKVVWVYSTTPWQQAKYGFLWGFGLFSFGLTIRIVRGITRQSPEAM